jgi:hypothetical protein
MYYCKVEDNKMFDSRQSRTSRFSPPPHFRLVRGDVVFFVVDEISQVVLESFVIGQIHSLQNLDNDGRETVAVEVDFLVVGDLADVAVERVSQRHSRRCVILPRTGSFC